MPEPLLTLVTPSYNQGQYLRETIESVLAQDFAGLEYWIIDGGSTDDSLEIIREYADRLQWISEPDQGQSDAIQKGFQRAQGKFIGWLNSDDRLKPGTLAQIAAACQASADTGLVYGDIDFIDASGAYISTFRSGELSHNSLLTISQSVPQAGSFYRRSLVEQIGGLDLNLNFAMDYDLFIRLLQTAPGIYLPTSLAEFRLHATSKTYQQIDRQFLREAYQVSRRHGAPLISHLNYQRALAIAKSLLKRMLGRPAINIERLRARQSRS